MAEKPTISSTVPIKTKLFYFVVGVLGCLFISLAHLFNINFELISSLGSILDLITGILFSIFSLLCFSRLTKKLDVYNDRIVRINLWGRKTIPFKEMNGHYVDDSLNNTLGFAKGYFRGIIVKKKDGSHFSLNKAELTEFDAIKKHFRSRARYFNNKSIKKLTNKEDRKLFLFLSFVLIILIASLLH